MSNYQDPGLLELTNDHSWLTEEWLCRSNLRSRTAELGIDLHANIRAILRLGLHDMSNIETWSQLVFEMKHRRWKLTLRDQGKATLIILLDALIHEGVATRENVEEDLWQSLGLVASSETGIVHRGRDVLTSLLSVDDGIALLDLTTMSHINLDEGVGEVSDNGLLSSALNDEETP